MSNKPNKIITKDKSGKLKDEKITDETPEIKKINLQKDMSSKDIYRLIQSKRS